MNRQELIERLRALPFPPEDYWVVAGGAMVLYGLREATRDIDLGCSRALADRLESEGFPMRRTEDEKRKFALGGDIEIFEEWLYDRVTVLDGIPVISLRGLLLMKEALGRDKDLADLALIRARLENR